MTASLSASKIPPFIAAVGRNITSAQFNMSSGVYSEGVKSIATSATAIPLGGITSCGWAFFYNSDATNFLAIRNGSGGADVIKLKAGEIAMLPLLDACVPYAIADTAACLLEFLIFSR